jgi:hypothetical protein
VLKFVSDLRQVVGFSTLKNHQGVLIRRVVFVGRVLIRRVAFVGRVLIRRVAFVGRVLMRGWTTPIRV